MAYFTSPVSLGSSRTRALSVTPLSLATSVTHTVTLAQMDVMAVTYARTPPVLAVFFNGSSGTGPTPPSTGQIFPRGKQ